MQPAPRLSRVLTLSLLIFATNVAQAALSVSFDSKPPQNRAIGSNLHFVASSSGAGTDLVLYRFDVAQLGEPFRLQKDYYLLPYTDFTPLEEGLYFIRVKARNWVTGETAEAIRRLSSRAARD